MMTSPEYRHVPVLFDAVIAWLAPASGGRYIDGTVGLGGHARGLLEGSAPDGRLMGLDADPQALEQAKRNLASYGERITLRQGRHKDLAELARANGFGVVDGILLDLGVSSLQLDSAERGFSFRADGPLDMRLGPDGVESAADLVNTLPQDELARIIWEYGEERYSRRIAGAICRERPFARTARLAEVVARAVPKRTRMRIHPATRTFQALRIAVNDELESLRQVLPQALDLLTPGGRLAVIAFHSLEDRIVKQFIVRESKDCICPPELPACVCDHRATLRNLTRKPIRPSEDEARENPRSSSARLRVAQKRMSVDTEQGT